MAIYDMPNVKAPYAISFSLKSLSSMQDNQYNAHVQTYENDEYWDGEIEWRNLSGHEVRALRNWMHKLRGPVHQFWFNDIRHGNYSPWAGAPAVDGANQDGTLLTIQGLNPGQLLQAGDRFQLGDHLHELMADVSVNAQGKADLDILPSIRIIPLTNTPLQPFAPRCKCFLLPNQKMPEKTSRLARLSSFKIKFREYIR